MKILKKTLYIALWFSSPLLFSQQKELAKADQQYAEHAYVNAAEIYREVAESGYESEELLEKLANSYYFNAIYKQASLYYGRLFDLGEKREPLEVLRFAQSLKASGQDKEAKKYFERYEDAVGKTGVNDDIDFEELLNDNSGRYEIQELKINSPGIDYGAARGADDQLIFASTRDTGVVRRNLSAWDGQGFLDLYVAADPSSSASSKKIRGKINTRMHESSAVITRDGSTMYFTRSRGVAGNGKDSISTLGIYRAHLMDGEWTNIEELSINSNNFSNAHPALNPGEDFMWFSSDRPGGYGQSDIYKVQIFEDNSMGKPVNLGGMVNTIGRETFPFVSSDGHLYFSSDGHYGLGGLDIFFWDPLDELTTYPINLGDPLNSPADDFAFTIDSTGTGYFSSNRLGGKGSDDIYSFAQQKRLELVHHTQIFGKVTDDQTGSPLAYSQITLIDSENRKRVSLNTDSKGNYKIVAARFTPFFVRAENEDYVSDEKAGIAEKRVQEINFQLDQNIFKLYKGEDLAKVLGIKTIYFDLDKAEIRPDAGVELQKVFAVMQKYPQVKIEIRSHTDNRASQAYNFKLSERRAKATKEYLLQKGIAAERLSAVGFGETRPIKECEDGTSCSEEEYQQNRRSEFILVDF